MVLLAMLPRNFSFPFFVGIVLVHDVSFSYYFFLFYYFYYFKKYFNSYFENLGCKVPEYVNPIEYYLKAIAEKVLIAPPLSASPLPPSFAHPFSRTLSPTPPSRVMRMRMSNLNS